MKQRKMVMLLMFSAAMLLCLAQARAVALFTEDFTGTTGQSVSTLGWGKTDPSYAEAVISDRLVDSGQSASFDQYDSGSNIQYEHWMTVSHTITGDDYWRLTATVQPNAGSGFAGIALYAPGQGGTGGGFRAGVWSDVAGAHPGIGFHGKQSSNWDDWYYPTEFEGWYGKAGQAVDVRLEVSQALPVMADRFNRIYARFHGDTEWIFVGENTGAVRGGIDTLSGIKFFGTRYTYTFSEVDQWIDSMVLETITPPPAPENIPEPASAGLILVGGLALLRRRMRERSV